jgi:hypothetical protein
VTPLTFSEFRQRWPDWPRHGRLLAFALLPEREQWECWDDLAERCRLRIEAELDYERQLREEWPPPRRHQPVGSGSTPAAMSRKPSAVGLASDDPLRKIAPRTYVEALTGEVPDARGWMRCPLPDHDDTTPSFQVLSTHWRCFGCNRGGSVIDFAAALWGIEPRGSSYHEIRRRLAADFGIRGSA